jgi:RND family efflux transporter MFP subunit
MYAKRLATVLLFFSALASAGCGAPEAPEAPMRSVRAFRVGDLKAVLGREFPGRAQAKDDVELSFQVAGPLVSLPVDVGSAVKKGDVIAAIDPRDFQSAVDTALGNLERAKANLLAMERGARPEEIQALEAALTEAQAAYTQAANEHQRNEELFNLDAISQRDLDISLARRDSTAARVKQAQENLNIGKAGARPEDLEAKRSEIKSLEATVSAAQNQLSYATLLAPFDGEVAARYVNNFQTVQAKQPIVRLLDVSKIEITVQVPENLISLVPQVKKTVCRFDAIPDREFPGMVTRIGSEASQTTRTYPVTVEVEQQADAKILPGMAATVRNQPPDESESGGDAKGKSLVVPAGAVFSAESGQDRYVWIVNDHKVTKRKVKTGPMTPLGLPVTEGLKAGEWVVTAGVNSLRENQEVKILEEGK